VSAQANMSAVRTIDRGAPPIIGADTGGFASTPEFDDEIEEIIRMILTASIFPLDKSAEPCYYAL